MNGLIVNSAVHFDVKVQAFGFTEFDQGLNLLSYFWNVGLTTKTWIDRHEKHLIHQVEHRLNGHKRSAWIDDHTHLHTSGTNFLQGSMQVNRCFCMNG